MAWRQSPGGSEQHLTRAAAATRTRTQRPGKHLAVHASELVVKPDFQILRRYRRPLLLRLEHTHRPTLEDYVHRATRLGSSRSLNLRIGIMGHGIEWMISVALWVTSFPGAVGRMAAFGSGPLLLCTAGLVVLCLLKTPLRFIGALLIGGAIMLMIRAPQPDVLIAADGSAAAVRGESGRLSVVKSGGDLFALREWLAADADARAPNDSTLGEGIRCDAVGCVGKLRDGSLVAIAKTTEAFEEHPRRSILFPYTTLFRSWANPAVP